MNQFTVADVPGAFERGQQFAQQAKIRPIELAQQQQLLSNQQQSGQFTGVQQKNLQQQIDQRTDQQKNQSLLNTALKVDSAQDSEIIPILESQIKMAESLGGDAADSKRALQLALTGDFEGVRRGAKNLIDIGVRQGDIKPVGGSQVQQSAEGITFEKVISGFSEADKVKARRMKVGLDAKAVGNAVQTIANSGTVNDIAEVEAVIADAKETGKLTAQQKLKPVVESAVIKAVGQAKAEVKKLGEERSNNKTLGIYNSAMGNLTKSLDGTITGPFVGFTPAMTSNAQIADGAIAMMIPLMKDVFRSAGEGTFTDGDQKVLTDMIPTRNDLPEARASKLNMIDSIMRAKLATAPLVQAQQDSLTEAEQTELQQLRTELGGQ